jgi:hypothetical protein
MDKPTVSASVHFVPDTGVCRAATITEVGPETRVGLHIHHQGEMPFRTSVPYSESKDTGSWHWPCGV